MNPSNSHDEIAREAYLLYQARGMSPGDDLADWLEAERRCQERRQRDGSAVQPASQREPIRTDHTPVTLTPRTELEELQNPFKGRKNRGTRDEIRAQVPHPAARAALDRSSAADGSR